MPGQLRAYELDDRSRVTLPTPCRAPSILRALAWSLRSQTRARRMDLLAHPSEHWIRPAGCYPCPRSKVLPICRVAQVSSSSRDASAVRCTMVLSVRKRESGSPERNGGRSFGARSGKALKLYGGSERRRFGQQLLNAVGLQESRRGAYGFLIPNLFIRDESVVGLSFRCAAAPSWP